MRPATRTPGLLDLAEDVRRKLRRDSPWVVWAGRDPRRRVGKNQRAGSIRMRSSEKHRRRAAFQSAIERDTL